jgi:hypothetical protein
MKTRLRWTLSVGLVVASGFTGLAHAGAVASSESNLAITIHVYDFARVAPQTLAEAETVAKGIFQKAGVETQWAHAVLTTKNDHENFAGHATYSLADIQLNIIPREMSDRLGLSNNVMGVVPGPDSHVAYVLACKVETVFQEMLSAYRSGRINRVSEGQILGHAIAHELGHLLLNQQDHSAHGIMRGLWGFADFRDMTCGMLLFTPQQAEFLRADVRRRNSRQETMDVAGVETPALAR